MVKNVISIFIFLSAFIFLLCLSYWQVQRLQWKNDIIFRLQAQYTKDPSQNNFSYKELNAFNPRKDILLYGQVTGRLQYNKEILVGPKPFNGSVGYQVITPLKFSSGQYILVNRGWIDNQETNAIKKIRPHQKITINGIFRKPDWNYFTPDNSPKNNIWTKLDIHEIAQEKNLSPTLPMMLYAQETSYNFAPILLENKKWYPRNKHLQYAIFWLSMAIALLIIFGLFIKKNRKT